MRHEAEMRAILKQVELWPVDEKRWLVRELAAALEPPIPPMPTGPWPRPLEERGSLLDLIGIANPTGRHFTDEDIDRIRYEAVAEKYGPFPPRKEER